MGSTACGMIFYGYIWEEEGEGPFGEDNDRNYDLREGSVRTCAHGHYDVPFAHISVVESEVTTSGWGDVERLSLDHFVVPSAWQEWLDTYINGTNANMDEAKGPSWFLAADYG